MSNPMNNDARQVQSLGKADQAQNPAASDQAQNQVASGRANATYTSNPAGHVSVMQDPNDPDSVIIRTRKRERKRSHSKKRRMGRGAKAAIIVVAVIVGIAAAAGIALAIAVNQGNVNLHRVFEGTDEIDAVEEASTQDQGQIVEYKGHTYRYNENIASVLVIGHDDESSMGYTDKALADMVALFTIDTSTNKVRATVIPRNSEVAVDLYDADGNFAGTSDMQLTLSHGVNLPTTAQCAENTVKSVTRLFYNLPIYYYFDFGPEVVVQATQAIGGVQVEALDDIPGASYAKGDTVILEGEEAYRYVQYRYVDPNVADESALVRQERQVQFVKAFVSKVKSLGAQGMLNVYNSVSNDVTTNLGPSEISYLASCLATGDSAQLEIASLKGTTKAIRESDGIEYEHYFLDEDSVMENVLAAFYTQVD